MSLDGETVNPKSQNSNQCEARTKARRRCKKNAIPGTCFCAIHSFEQTDRQLRTQYGSLHPVAERFAESLQHQLESLITANNLTLGVPIERRVKDLKSISEKLERKHIELNGIPDLDDFVGLRLIFLFKRDLVGIHSLLYKKFEVLSYENTESRLQETQFGYQSGHYVVSFPDDWFSVPSMSEFKGLKAELQVRTLAQHIWAATSHKLQYKHEAIVPRPLRRSIHRVSALLETVDLEFERLLRDREAYMDEISATDNDERLLNVDILQKVLMDRWPKKNASPYESYAELFYDLAIFEIDTISRLNTLIDDNYDYVLAIEKERVKEAKRELGETGNVTGTDKDRTQRGVFFTLTGLTREALINYNPLKWVKRTISMRNKV